LIMKKKKKALILGLTGSIAAYKIPQMARDLHLQGYDITAVLTENAKKFVTPWTLEALTGNPCFSHMFYLKSETIFPHIELSKKATLLVIAPATANFIAKAAFGIADDLLSALFLSCTCPRLIAPAMNERMYNNIQTKKNISNLKKKDVHIMSASTGLLACGEQGAGRMADPKIIIRRIHTILEKK